MILAVCGKGGVGKTTISAIAAQALHGDGLPGFLVVDGDPSGGLGLALGLKAEKSLNDVRKEIIAEIKAGERSERGVAVSMDYLLAEALSEKGNLAFLSIGRPEDEGCYCRVNSFLKEAIEGLAGEFANTVIDAEAGIEQVNRKVLSGIDFILLVSDTSGKGIQVAETIEKVARQMGSKGKAGLVVNRVRDEREVATARERTSLDVIGWIPEDDTVRAFDEEMKPFFGLPDCAARESVRKALEAAGLVQRGAK
jgi:CO dehydrogenase maturation factor